MADTGETPTREHKEQKYLSLDPRGEFDPRIATLPARLYRLFVQIRMMALSQDAPGILDIAWPVLCECLGVRNPGLQERYAQLLEERRLIGFRKDDEAIVIARWTMPQLDAQSFRREPLPPRKRYPSDFRRGRKGDDAAQDSAQDAPPTAPQQAQTDVPSADLQQFFGDPATGETAATERPAESGAETRGAAAESARSLETKPNKERKKEAKACPPNPLPAESEVESGQANAAVGRPERQLDAGQAGQAGGQAARVVSDTERKEVEQALLAQKVHAGNAHSIAYAPNLDAGQVYAQIDALPDRKGEDPPGLLVTAIRQRLPFPPAYIERLQAKSNLERLAQEQLAAETRREARLRESDAQVDRVLAANQKASHSAEREGGYAAL